MITFNVSQAKAKELRDQMERMGVAESDFEESFTRSQGKGGQNVNKVSTCVVLKHVPSGLTVKCQKERSQALNRYLARRRLLDKIEEEQKGRLSAKRQEIEKIRRQKRKRSKRAKEKILESKRKNSALTALRKRINPLKLRD